MVAGPGRLGLPNPAVPVKAGPLGRRLLPMVPGFEARPTPPGGPLLWKRLIEAP